MVNSLRRPANGKERTADWVTNSIFKYTTAPLIY
jgi:hypothetical protein